MDDRHIYYVYVKYRPDGRECYVGVSAAQKIRFGSLVEDKK
jgi:hypothetical protein